VVVAVILSAAAMVVDAAGDDSGSTVTAGSAWGLSAIEGSPEATTDSTIVEVPVSITLKAPDGRRVGFGLRLSVFFAWNNVRFEDVDGDDIAASLRTLTVVPGAELVVPVGDRWVIRPYGQIGGLQALDIDGHRWLASVGMRAGAAWDFERWRLLAGGRAEYTSILDEEGRRVDEVAWFDVGAGFSWPLWFDVAGEPASGGLFVFPRVYMNPAALTGQGGLVTGIESHVEVGASFEIHDRPKLWFARLPSWYGVGVRFGDGYRSVRIYLGFPF